MRKVPQYLWMMTLLVIIMLAHGFRSSQRVEFISDYNAHLLRPEQHESGFSED